MMSRKHVLKLQGVAKRFVSPEGIETDVLRGIDLDVAEGESVAIVGPSGSGKSTLLNIIGTLDKPSSGSVMLNGTNVAELDEVRLADMRARQIGFVFQMHHLLPQCTVLENVLVPTLPLGPSGNDVSARALSLLERVGLSHRVSYRPARLSVGECQRAAVVRALINRPKLLLADEPTGSLDRANAENIASVLVELNRQEKAALILITHSMRLAEKMDRVLTLRDGRLCGQATVADTEADSRV